MPILWQKMLIVPQYGLGEFCMVHYLSSDIDIDMDHNKNMYLKEEAHYREKEIEGEEEFINLAVFLSKN